MKLVKLMKQRGEVIVTVMAQGKQQIESLLPSKLPLALRVGINGHALV